MSRRPFKNQRGVVLVVALIMLLLVTLIAVVTTNSIRTNLQIVQNIEARAAVKNAVVHALEEAIAYGQFPNGRVAVIHCNGASTFRVMVLKTMSLCS